MKKYIIAITAGLALCLAGCVFASGDTFAAPHSSFARTGAVIGVTGGYGFLNTPELTYPEDSSTYTSSIEKGEFVYGIHAGYEFLVAKTFLLGVEAGYKNLGESKVSFENYNEDKTLNNSFDQKVEQHAVDALLTGRYFVYKGVNLFAKVGMAYVSSKVDTDTVTSNDVAATVASKDTLNSDDVTIWRFRPEVALGVGYLFNKNVNAYVVYDHIASPVAFDANYRSTIYSSNAAMFGLEYKF